MTIMNTLFKSLKQIFLVRETGLHRSVLFLFGKGSSLQDFCLFVCFYFAADRLRASLLSLLVKISINHPLK